ASIKEGKIQVPQEFFSGLQRNLEIVGRWQRCAKELNRFAGEIHDFALSQVQEIGARNINTARAREMGIKPSKPQSDVKIVNVEHPQWGDDLSLTASFYQRFYGGTSSSKPHEVWITVRDQKVQNARGEWVSDQQRLVDHLKRTSGLKVSEAGPD